VDTFLQNVGALQKLLIKMLEIKKNEIRVNFGRGRLGKC